MKGRTRWRAWYRKVSALVRGNEAVKTGANEMLNLDDQSAVAWVRRPAAVSYKNPAVVFVCNMTDKPVTSIVDGGDGEAEVEGDFFAEAVAVG